MVYKVKITIVKITRTCDIWINSQKYTEPNYYAIKKLIYLIFCSSINHDVYIQIKT